MITLYKKSCEGMSELKPSTVDLIVTAPPCREEDGYSIKLMRDVARHSYRVLKPGTSCFVSFSQLSGHKDRPFEVANIFAEEFEWIDTIICVKSNPWTGGHFTPINSKYRLNSMYDYLFQFSKGKTEIDRLALGIPYMDKNNIARYGRRDVFDGHKKDIRCAGNVWYIPCPNSRHKDSFPEDLPRRCIKLAGIDPGSVILDPFMGSGTTGRMAIELGHTAIGYEINEEYWNKKKDMFES